MENREHYIRYRIYVQSAEKADRAYGKRVIKNLHNLHNNIKNDRDYWYKDIEPIKDKTFIPKDLNHVNPIYSTIISTITEYFNCYAYWNKVMIKGTIKPINTFTIVGPTQDMLLSYHYVTKLINNLNDMRFNMRKEYRRLKVNRRRRGETNSKDNHASINSSKYFYGILEDINKVCKEILEDRPIYPNLSDNLLLVEKYLRNNKILNFRAYHYGGEPKIHNAYSRPGKFQIRRIIR